MPPVIGGDPVRPRRRPEPVGGPYIGAWEVPSQTKRLDVDVGQRHRHGWGARATPRDRAVGDRKVQLDAEIAPEDLAPRRKSKDILVHGKVWTPQAVRQVLAAGVDPLAAGGEDEDVGIA